MKKRQNRFGRRPRAKYQQLLMLLGLCVVLLGLVGFRSEERDRSAEAEAAARVIYGTARNHTAEAWRNLVWCIINRVESPLYPDTMKDVCRQEAQWMGYSDDNPVLQAVYEVAYEVLSTWHEGGHRLIGQRVCGGGCENCPESAQRTGIFLRCGWQRSLWRRYQERCAQVPTDARTGG